MEDGHGHQDGDEIEADSAAAPSTELSLEPAGAVVATGAVREGAIPEDSDDASGLTGVLAALEEPEPEDSFHSEPQADEAEPSQSAPAPDDEIAALQAELEADEVAEEPVAIAPVTAAGVEVAPEIELAAAPEAEPVAVAAPATTSAVVADVQEPEPGFFPEERRGVPIWPFLVYFGAWIVFAGLLVWQFMQTPAGVPLYELDLYGPSILAGLVLTAFGPLLAIGVWLVVWLARPEARSGLFSRSFIIGAVVTLVGVALWLIALGAVDMLRLGRLI